MKFYILDENKKPRAAELMEWATWFSIFENRIIRQTDIHGVFVSTVFLGIDHRWDDGPPLLFETMIFKLNENDSWQERFCTYEEALKGHEKALNYVEFVKGIA